jgi:hypothetical protein
VTAGDDLDRYISAQRERFTEQLRDRENYWRALRAATRLYSELATAH